MRSFFKYGLLVALINILLVLFLPSESTAGTPKMSSYITIIALWIAVPLSIYEVKKRSYKNYLTFPHAFKLGLKTTSISALLICIFTFIYLKHINPGAIAFTADANLDEEMIKRIPFMAATSALLLILLLGGLCTAICALIFRNEPPVEELN